MNPVKVGIFGAGRGVNLANPFMLAGAEIVAVCDNYRLERATRKLGDGFALYDDFDKFIEHDMDAVIIANNFHEHTPYVIKCLERGLHVYSECLSNSTMAEGVALARAAEKSNAIYFMAENYPNMIFTREIKRICEGGTLGKILYAEGEYNHPVDPWDKDFKKSCVLYPMHWRNYLPGTYYITHSMGPIIAATGALPKKVSAYASFAPRVDDVPVCSYVGDQASIVTTQNDDGSVFRFTGCAAFGAHHNSYRVCGTEGQVENLRGMGDKVMLRYNDWSKPEGMEEKNLYDPAWNDPDEELIEQGGHGGSDFITARLFLDCVREGKQPEKPFDLRSALAMASTAILGHRSILNGNACYDIPDFSLEEDRIKYENDDATPFYYSDGRKPTIPCCSVPDYAPTETQLRLYAEMMEKQD